jgi:hypothetical protein
MAGPLQSITEKRGNTIRWPVTFLDAVGKPMPLTDYVIECEVRKPSDHSLVVALAVQLANQTTNPGELDLYLADTSALELGTYLVDLRYAEPDGDSFATETWGLVMAREVTVR